MNSAISNSFIAERLYSLNTLLSRKTASTDQIQITSNLFNEYKQEAEERGLDVNVLIKNEHSRVATLFTRKIFQRN